MDNQTRALSALHALDPGCDRNTWIRIGMAAKAAGLNFEDFDQWSGSAANYEGDRACRQQWDSLDADGPVKAGTLYAQAFEAGWKDPSPKNGHGKPKATRLGIPLTRPKKAQQRPDTRESVAEFWNRCTIATEEHPYIVAKRGTPDGLRIVPAENPPTIGGHCVAGWLAVPACSLDGTLRTLQLIPPPGIGKKLNMPGASFDDGMFIVGDREQSDRLFIVEGIGQAWACWQATGCAAVVAFGAGRMATIARLLRDRYPERRLVIVPDHGKETQAAEIARTLQGEWVELPDGKASNYDINDFAVEYGADELAELLSQTRRPPPPQLRYRLLKAAEVATLPPLPWLVRGVLPASGLASIYGASASGKSFLALDMSATIAEGAQWFGCRVTAAAVVYVALEGEHGFRQRVKAWEAHQGRPMPSGLHFIMQPFALRSADDLADLSESIKATGCAGGVLVIDTMNRAAADADENSSRDMGEIIEAAKRLQTELSGVVLLVHHTGKDATKGLRGHSSLFAALDAAIEVSRTDERREWRIAKSKDDSDGDSHAFRLVQVEIGTDEYGDPITSCAVEPDQTAGSTSRPRVPKGGNQRIAWDVIGELLRNSQHFGKGGAAPTRPCIELDAAIEAIAPRLTCEAKRQRERARQAMTGLISSGLLEHREGWLWVR